MKERLQKPEYLGDGVYVGFDGYHIVLWLQDPGVYGENAIALEPHLFQDLKRYAEKVLKGGK